MRWRQSRRRQLAVIACAAISSTLVMLATNGESGAVCQADITVSKLPPMPEDDATMIKILFTFITQPNNRTCRKVVSFGGKLIVAPDWQPVLNGNTFACMDPEYGLADADDCLVYSIGDGGDRPFDRDAEAFGCAVVAFGRSVAAAEVGRHGGVSRSRYGVGSADFSDRERDLEVRTLETLVGQLNHQRRTIHYMRMDVEEMAWGVLRQQAALGRESTLQRSVEQLGLKLHLHGHLPLADNVPFLRQTYGTFLGLQRMGFHLLAYAPNTSMERDIDVPGLGDKIALAMEVVWVKIRCVNAV